MPVIAVKKYIYQKLVYKIPKPNLITIPSISRHSSRSKTECEEPQECIEMKTFHNNSRIIQVEDTIEVIEEKTLNLSTNNANTISTVDPTMPQNLENTPRLPKNAKSNKNLISFTGVLVLVQE